MLNQGRNGTPERDSAEDVQQDALLRRMTERGHVHTWNPDAYRAAAI